MVNILIIAVIFVIVLIVMAGFIAQQFHAVQKVAAARPKTLIEKMNSGGTGALNTDRFKEIVMSTPSENPTVLGSPGEGSRTGPGEGSNGNTGELPEEELFMKIMPSTGQPLNLEEKNLQAIYAEYLSAKNLHPFDVEPDFNLGVAYLKFAQYEKAQGEFQKVIEAKPDFPGIYYYLGEAYRCNGQFYEAMKAYKKSWELKMHDRQKAHKDKA